MHQSEVSLVPSDGVTNSISNSPGRLRHGYYSIDKSVKYSTDAERCDEVLGELWLRRGGEEDARAYKPGQYVLQVVQKCSTRSLDVRIVVNDSSVLTHKRYILRAYEDLEIF